MRHLRLSAGPSVEELDISTAQKLETVKLTIATEAAFWEAKVLAKQVEASQRGASSLAWAKIEYPEQTGLPFYLRSSSIFKVVSPGRPGIRQAICHGKSPADPSTCHLTSAGLDHALISHCEEYGTAHIWASIGCASYFNILMRRTKSSDLERNPFAGTAPW